MWPWEGRCESAILSLPLLPTTVTSTWGVWGARVRSDSGLWEEIQMNPEKDLLTAIREFAQANGATAHAAKAGSPFCRPGYDVMGL